MITVTILINGHPILTRSAVNVGLSQSAPKDHMYEVDDGNVVYHNPDDGAVALAHKLLDLIKEQK